MERLGTVHRVTSNLLILRGASSDPAPIGTAAIDETVAEIGRVVDVFGPTNDPFLAVNPEDSVNAAPLVQEPLYWRPSS